MNTVNVAMPLWLWALLLGFVLCAIAVLLWIGVEAWQQRESLAPVETEHDAAEDFAADVSADIDQVIANVDEGPTERIVACDLALWELEIGADA